MPQRDLARTRWARGTNLGSNLTHRLAISAFGHGSVRRRFRRPGKAFRYSRDAVTNNRWVVALCLERLITTGDNARCLSYPVTMLLTIDATVPLSSVKPPDSISEHKGH